MISNNICLAEVIRRLSMDEIEDCIVVGDTFSDLHILPSFDLESHNPTTKELRLIIDVVNQHDPSLKKYPNARTDYIRKTFFYNESKERITNIKPFKQILFKKVITKTKPIPNSNKYEVLVKKIRKYK